MLLLPVMFQEPVRTSTTLKHSTQADMLAFTLNTMGETATENFVCEITVYILRAVKARLTKLSENTISSSSARNRTRARHISGDVMV